MGTKWVYCIVQLTAVCRLFTAFLNGNHTDLFSLLSPSLLLSPDLEGLRCLHYIQSLRREAHQALNEHVRLIHREDTTRFAKLLIALSMLRAISPPVVAQLFFKPIIGTVNIEEVLMEMFYGK